MKNTLLVHCMSAPFMLAVASAAQATVPQIDGPMVHIGVYFDGAAVQLTAPPEQGLPLLNHKESYDAPADVLDGMGYSSQYGFLPSQAFALPENTGLWIEMIDQTAGLETYEGGMRPMVANHTFDPMFGTDGSPAQWQWDGNMHHPWYAAEDFGEYDATYKVYIGDLTGNELGEYDADTVTLTWVYAPEPSTGLLALTATVAVFSRRRKARTTNR